MKVFFSYSISGKPLYSKQYNTISKYLESHSYTNTNNEINSVEPEEFYKKIQKSGYELGAKLYNDLLIRIRKSDLCVFESSAHSLSTGYLIQKSLELNKPTIALYMENCLPHFLTTIDEDKFQLIQYNDTNLENKLDSAIDAASKMSDKRFNFFISPKLLTYLNEASKADGVTKSTFIRNLILDYKKNKTT